MNTREIIAADEMIEGYSDGLTDVRTDPPAMSNRSPAYWHGWLNGRDDRIGKPRSSAMSLRSRAAMLEAAQEQQ